MINRNPFQDAKSYICSTQPASQTEKAVVDAQHGYIPLWQKGKALRWTFAPSSLDSFVRKSKKFDNVNDLKDNIRGLLIAALKHWGSAVPIKLSENKLNPDIKIKIRSNNHCDNQGCITAEAFFPNSNQNYLWLYPVFFEYSRNQQIVILAHELGHIFGLRHTFALKDEDEPAEEFGRNDEFSIMGPSSKNRRVTLTDKKDLSQLYKLAWDNKLSARLKKTVRLQAPFHEKRRTV